MKAVSCLPAARTLRGLTTLLLFLCALPLPARALINYDWNAPVSGNADDPNRWNPFGVPNVSDYTYFGQSGTYTVTYPASAPGTSMISFLAGNVTFNMASPHTTHELLVGFSSGAPTLTLAYGGMNADYLNLGYPGSLTRLTLTSQMFNGSASLHTWSMGNRYYSGSAGDIVGYGGITYLDVFGGAQYTCERSTAASWPLQIGMLPTAVGTIAVAGRNALLFQNSALRVTGSEVGEGMIAGVAGTANIFVYNGGYMDVAGNMMIAQLASSSGYVNIGPSTGIYTGALRVHNHLWIGFNFYDTVQAGHGEVIVKGNGNWAVIGGRCDVGDPDNDALSVLRVGQGATFRVNGGIKVWPTTGLGLDLRGGLTHVRGGALIWPPNKYLTVSSQVGTPVLTISGGVASTGPSTPANNAQLFVGRGGTGTLRVTQPGTVFAMGFGSTTVADSLGGVGTVIVDSLGALTSGGPINVGVRGNGTLNVRGGSLVDLGTAAIGVASTGVGSALVNGAGSTLQVRNNLWIGGGFGGIGGLGTVSADTGGTINVLHTGGVNPALTTIYADAGSGPPSLTLANGGKLVTTGTVSNSGRIALDAGRIEALNVSMPGTGRLTGSGQLVTMLQSNGTVDPGSPTALFGTLAVTTSYVEYGAGHFAVDLGHAGAAVCDLLAITGPATLAGALDLRTDPDAPPSPGDIFTILTCTSRSGSFSAVTWNGSPLVDQATVVYGPTSVQVVMPGSPSAVGPGTAPGTPAELRFGPAGGSGGSLAFALELPEAADVQVKVYDIRGREAAALQAGSLGAGPHRLTALPRGHDLASGVYFARAVIRSSGQTIVRTARTLIVH